MFLSAVLIFIGAGFWILRGVHLPDPTNPVTIKAETDEEFHQIETATKLFDRSVTKLGERKALEAWQLVNEAVRLVPDVPEFWALRCDVSATLGRYEEALSDCDQAIKLRPTEVYFGFCRSLRLTEMGRLQEAEELLSSILETAPDFATARAVHAAILLSQGKVDETVEAVGMSITRYKSSVADAARLPALYAARGFIRVILKGDQGGIDDLAHATLLDPRDGERILQAVIVSRALEPAAQANVDDEWDPLISALVRVYRGDVTAEAPVHWIGEQPYPMRRNDLTNAHYYLGEWFLLAGNAAMARQQFRAALDEGVAYAGTYGLAKARLLELDAAPL
jgi:tetratricopeptide (TPR) repeat protein